MKAAPDCCFSVLVKHIMYVKDYWFCISEIFSTSENLFSIEAKYKMCCLSRSVSLAFVCVRER